MRTLLTPASHAPGRFGCRVLLALALCACGRGDGTDKSGDAAAPARTAAVQAAAGEPCTSPPPTVDTAFFSRTWAELEKELERKGARFPDVEGNSDTATVPLCPGCSAAKLIIHAEARAYCTQPRDVEIGETRLMGVFVLDSDFQGDSSGWGPIAKGETIYTFTSNSGDATLVYRRGENAATAPAGSWAFYYCDDGAVGTRPEAKWRPRLVPRNGQPNARRGGVEYDGGSYGWMACASGCCQFYTPPPNPIVGDPGPRPRPTPRAGQAPGAGPRPTWCVKRDTAAVG
jgi:hypothetical protein